MSLEEITKEPTKNKSNQIGKTIINLIAGPSIAISILAGINFYFNHNVNYETDDKIVFKKADQILANTEVNIGKGKHWISITRTSILQGYRSYTDEDGDKKVDTIYSSSSPFKRGSHWRSFSRDKHFEDYKDIFETADKEFSEQLKRFNIKNR